MMLVVQKVTFLFSTSLTVVMKQPEGIRRKTRSRISIKIVRYTYPTFVRTKRDQPSPRQLCANPSQHSPGAFWLFRRKA